MVYYKENQTFGWMSGENMKQEAYLYTSGDITDKDSTDT